MNGCKQLTKTVINERIRILNHDVDTLQMGSNYALELPSNAVVYILTHAVVNWCFMH